MPEGTTLKAMKTEEKFQEIYSHATELYIQPTSMPHIHHPPNAHTPTTTEEHYRTDFFKVQDTVDMQLKDRFDQGDLKMLAKLEQVLLTGEMDTAVDQYPELNQRSLKLFKLQYPYTTTSEAAAILRN